MTNGIDYSRQTDNESDKSGNLFESGSRHPLWKGGVDAVLKKNRAKVYRKHGIGISLAANSNWTSKDPFSSQPNIDDFINGRINRFEIKFDTSSKDEKNKLYAVIQDLEVPVLKKKLNLMIVESKKATVRLTSPKGLLIQINTTDQPIPPKSITTAVFQR